MTTIRARKVCGAALAAALLAAPTGARAGTYTAWACHRDDGATALFAQRTIDHGDGGWNHVGDHPNQFRSYCGAGEIGLEISPWSTWSSDQADREHPSRVQFTAPAGTTIEAWRFERIFRNPNDYMGEREQLYEVKADERLLSGWTLDGTESRSPVLEAYGSLGARTVSFGFRCLSRCRSVTDRSYPPRLPRLESRWQQVTLRDDVAPTVTGASGSLVSQRELRGPADVTLSATDAGAGIYRVIVLADDEVAATPVVGEGEFCADIDPGDVDPFEFQSTAPCRDDATATVSVDTTALLEGEHAFTVLVEDAAGNRSLAAGPWRAKVNNRLSADDPQPASVPSEGEAPAAPNGRGASTRALLRVAGAERRSIDFGQGQNLAVTLKDQAGTPIAGAELVVSERPALALAPWTGVGSVRTDDKGRARIPLRAGPSRTVRLAYAAALGASEPDAIAEVELVVRAGTSARVNRKRARNGDRVRFTGALRGLPVPEKGVLVELQAWTGERWQTFRSVRTSSAGRWKASYRFKRTLRAVRYAFRAQVAEDSGYPYARGVSRVIGVTVRP